MKEKTEWKQPPIWIGKFSPEFAFFLDGADLKWVNFYSREVTNALGSRAGQILGDE